VSAPSQATSSGPYLRLEQLVKDFGGTGSATYRAVNQVSLDIERGEIFALLGPSGCGKTTLLRMLAGFETPTSGRILLNGANLADKPPYARPINMMFQSYALFPHLNVWDNIAFGLRRDGMARGPLAQRVDAMLKLVQLETLAQRKPHQLSGGQQQRVALARSLARQPQLLLLDEPLGALDKKLREATQIELVNIIRQVVTHDQEEAMTMASRIAVMNEGNILQVGAPSEIYETPANRFVADFIGNVNLMEGTLVQDHADHCIIACRDCYHYVGHGITGTQSMAVSVALRPEKILLSRSAPADTAYNAVQGTVRELAYFGSFTVYHLALASGSLLKVSAANTERHREDTLACGDVAWAYWAPSAHVVLTQ
jgi:putrescine transport system ATP-binding protein